MQSHHILQSVLPTKANKIERKSECVGGQELGRAKGVEERFVCWHHKPIRAQCPAFPMFRRAEQAKCLTSFMLRCEFFPRWKAGGEGCIVDTEYIWTNGGRRVVNKLDGFSVY